MHLNAVKPVIGASRFAVLKLVFLISLPTFFVFRIILLVRHFGDLDVPFYKIIAAFLLGAINDLAFLSYLLVPFILYLLVLPNQLYRSWFNKIFIYTVFFASLYGLYFTTVAEWLFWDEFSVRFNFIAVDYLIYTHEVFNNIIESYPLPALLTGILLLSALTFGLCKKSLLANLALEEDFLTRLKIASGLLLFPIISFALVGQSLHQISSNKFVNEITANGPYQFFAAFKNNEIDYHQFYALGDDQALSDKIKHLVSGANGSALDKSIYDIKRVIKATEPEKPLNVIMIMVESLSADFFARFGNKENITPFMDKLFDESLLFTNFYATGTRTDRGLEA